MKRSLSRTRRARRSHYAVSTKKSIDSRAPWRSGFESSTRISMTSCAITDSANLKRIEHRRRVMAVEMHRIYGASEAVRTPRNERPHSRREAFKLYDTYGLPRDFIEDVARDSGIRCRLDRIRHARWRSSARAPEPPGKARTRKPPIPSTRSSRKHTKPSPISISAPTRATAASKPSSPKAAR